MKFAPQTRAFPALLACCLGLTTAALATEPVAFKVDLSVKTAEGAFDPGGDTVEVRGSFNNWSGGSPLVDPDGDLVFEGTFDLDSALVGQEVPYKFVALKAGTAAWESDPNRSFTLQAGGQTLPVDYFDRDAQVSTEVPVTFRVNLGVKIAEGLFHPDTDVVEVRGSFNNWSGGSALTDTNGDRIYEGTFPVLGSAGQAFQYKFVSITTTTTWEGDPNRSFALQSSAQTLDTVFFDRDETISIPVNAEIVFQVDLSVQIAVGKFDPSRDEVWVRGTRMGWGNPPEGVLLAKDDAHPGIYRGAYQPGQEPPFLTGEKIEYKHVVWNTADSTVRWEGGGNKSVTLDGSEPEVGGFRQKVIPAAYFDGISPADVFTEETSVTFRVNMARATRTDGTPFDPAGEGVWLNGSFAGWWSWGTQPGDYRLVDDGTAGDAQAGDLVYTLVRVFQRGDPRNFDYKYGIESSDNEAGFAKNHTVRITGQGPVVLPYDVFGAFPVTLAVKLAPTGDKVTVTWPGAPGLKLQRTPTLSAPAWEDVPNTDGLSSIELPVGVAPAFFRTAQQ